MTPPLVTLIQLPSLVDSGSVLYEIQMHLNYWHILQQRWSVPESLVLQCPYRRMMSLGILPLMLCVFDCLSSEIPSWKGNENALLTRVKLQLFPLKLPAFFIFLRSAAYYFPRIWNHMLVSDVSAPPDFRQC